MLSFINGSLSAASSRYITYELAIGTYKKIPVITNFTDEDGNDRMKETVQANYRRIKEEVKQIVQDELERIAGDDNLKHLLQ